MCPKIFGSTGVIIKKTASNLFMPVSGKVVAAILAEVNNQKILNQLLRIDS